MLSLETPFSPASKDEAVPGSSSEIPLAILKWQSLSLFQMEGPKLLWFFNL